MGDLRLRTYGKEMSSVPSVTDCESLELGGRLLFSIQTLEQSVRRKQYNDPITNEPTGLFHSDGLTLVA